MATQVLTTPAHGRIPAHALATTKVFPEDAIFAALGDLDSRALADEIGRVDALAKAVEARLKALKAEFVERKLSDVVGAKFAVSATAQTSWRLDTAAVRKHLGDACSRFETVSSTTVVRVKAHHDHKLAVLAGAA